MANERASNGISQICSTQIETYAIRSRRWKWFAHDDQTFINRMQRNKSIYSNRFDSRFAFRFASLNVNRKKIYLKRRRKHILYLWFQLLQIFHASRSSARIPVYGRTFSHFQLECFLKFCSMITLFSFVIQFKPGFNISRECL